jgi:hypothetical protein
MSGVLRMAQAGKVSAQNYEQFREYLAAVLVECMSESSTKAERRKDRSARKKDNGRLPAEKATSANGEDHGEELMEDLAEFIDYMATEIFEALPPEIQALDYVSWADNPKLADALPLPMTADAASGLLSSLDPSLEASLSAYQILDTASSTLIELLVPVLNSYLTEVTTPPPASRPSIRHVDACEICGRDWITLTYHHLIPREVHDKVVKRGWHRKDQLNNVAWLCRPCHNFVHEFASNEDLARHYYTTELLLEQDDVTAFARWAAKLRWKGGGTMSRR